MNLRRHFVPLLAFFLFLPSAGAQPGGRIPLLQPSREQLPGDTGSPETKLEIVESKDLGGKALKVKMVDSFGQLPPPVADWKPHTALVFSAVNPGNEDVTLDLSIKHNKSKDFQTRVNHEITLKPGKNDIRLVLADLKNVNKSAPDFSQVTHWYLANSGKPVTLFFGDFFLEGGAKQTGGAKVSGDPARLARIRAAKMPKIEKPIEFFTPEADAICSALEVFPPDNPWNLLVENWPVHPNSRNIINSIGAKKPLLYNPDMAFILVPPDQKKVDLKVVEYPDESDKGPFPLPDNTPIEGWPVHFSKTKLTLEEVQRDKNKEGGDRHAIVVDPMNRKLYEFFVMKKTKGGWQAEQSSIFDLSSNKLRPDGWTSADAAGLPIFPAVVRHDEIQRGVIDHALRVTVVKSRRAYVYPATHFASPHKDENLPRMGERIRLRHDFDVTGFSKPVQTILTALKRYGMLVADNGIDWAVSVTPDPRIPELHAELRKVKGSDFEVVTPPAGYVPAN